MRRFITIIAAVVTSAVAPVASASPVRDALSDVGVRTTKEETLKPLGAGVDFEFGSTLVDATGRAFDASGADMHEAFGIGYTLQTGVSYYATDWLGVLVAGRFVDFAGPDGCGRAKDCGAFALQLPVMVELAPFGRTEGPFVRAGLGAFTYYAGYDSSTTIALKSTFGEYKALAGWRWSPGRRGAIDFGLGIDAGRFDHVETHGVPGALDAEITKKAWHYTLGLDVTTHFHL
jgi:hypothetical protein